MIYKQSGKIEIIIRKDDGASMVGANEQDTNQSPNNEQTETKGKSKSFLGLNKRQVKLHSIHIAQTVKHALLTSVTLAVNNQGRVNGDQALQQISERNIEMVKDTLNPLINAGVAAGGAAIGSGGNPVAIALSATLSLANSAISLFGKYEERRREYILQACTAWFQSHSIILQKKKPAIKQ